MNYQEYVNKNKEIQNKILLFLDKEDDVEANYDNLIELFTNYKIMDDYHEFKSLLYLISKISSNHYQMPSFNSKVEQLIKYLKSDIKKNFTNLKIFDIFKSSKSTLLILIEQEILIFDQSIMKRISEGKYFKRSYHHFFFPEIQPLIEKGKISFQSYENNSSDDEEEDEKKFIDSDNDETSNESYNESDKSIEKNSDYVSDDDTEDNFNFYQTQKFINFFKKFSKELPDNFLKLRKIGQNENHICKLIREDLIDEFISYVNQHDYSLNSNIVQSIYETNPLLIKNNPTLIEYAAFFGSIQIFKYLFLNKAKLTRSIWIYAVHSDNPELINFLEENHIKPKNRNYFECFKEAIKCHHIDVSNYIQINYLKEEFELDHFNNNFKETILSYIFHYYNYFYFPGELDNRFILFYACKYDYYTIVEYLLKTKDINVENKIILFILFNEVYLFILLVFLLFNMQLKEIILK